MSTPRTRPAIMPVDARPTVSAPDDDPYVWLEEIDGARALAWVGEQNALTLARFGTAGFAADRDTLAAVLVRPDNIPFVTRRGPYLYNIWKDAKNPRGLWRRTTLASFRTAQPHWEVLRYRRARGRGKRGLDLARRLDTAGDARPGDPVSVARGQRRSRSARVRHRRQDIREWRILPTRGQGRHCLAGPRHIAAVQRVRRTRHGDHLGLLQNGSLVAARYGGGASAHSA